MEIEHNSVAELTSGRTYQWPNLPVAEPISERKRQQHRWGTTFLPQSDGNGSPRSDD